MTMALIGGFLMVSLVLAAAGESRRSIFISQAHSAKTSCLVSTVSKCNRSSIKRFTYIGRFTIVV
jgi:hypothetical protein